MSEHLRSERDDLHEALLAQLPADRPEDTGAARLAVGLQDHRGVLVEADVGAVRTPALLHGPHDDRLDDVTLLHTTAGDRVLDGGDDRVTDTGVATTGATEHADAKDLLRARVVGDLQSRLLLDHLLISWLSRWFSAAPSLAERMISIGFRLRARNYLAFSRISTTRQRLVADSGRVSISSTRSPMPAAFCSSCAFSLLVRRMTLPYRWCFTRSSTS